MSPASFQQEQLLRLTILSKYPKPNLHRLYGSYMSQHEIILNTINALGLCYDINTSMVGLGFLQIPSSIASRLIQILKSWDSSSQIIASRDVVSIVNTKLNLKYQYSVSSHSRYDVSDFATKKALSTVH
jgi:hypothetical protein